MSWHSIRFIEGVSPSTGTLAFTFEGRACIAHPGETIASALMRAGIAVMRRTRREDAPRSYFCGMGICWECAVHVEGMGVVRGCGEPVTAGMTVRLAEGDC